MPYEVQIAPAAERQIQKLARTIQLAVIARLESLAEDPRPPGCEKLSGETSLYRVRLGDYRIIYDVQDKSLTVLVVKVGHRGDVYRKR